MIEAKNTLDRNMQEIKGGSMVDWKHSFILSHHIQDTWKHANLIASMIRA